jgi:hypothetical protein
LLEPEPRRPHDRGPHFVERVMSIAGLPVELPIPCRRCRRSFIATISMEQNPASLRCIKCAAHPGYVSEISYDFIAEIIKNFGPITSPIAMRLGATSDAAMTQTVLDEDN